MSKTVTLVVFILLSQSILVAQKPNEVGNSIIIHQEVNINASPQRVYDILLNATEFSACIKKSFKDFTTANATIDSKVGGVFSLFDGHIIGRNLELVPNTRIVQAWRVVDWPTGIYSIAKFEIKAEGAGTRIVFDHTGFPDGLKEHLATGWQQHYWDALNKYLN
ncbi:MAG TPA: SRPBCC domain-containing protein [Cyclobacteriaceae bacterium]|nr:SRPBCC domain-containing protein [Cyclobacteriaceae bacterium]